MNISNWRLLKVRVYETVITDTIWIMFGSIKSLNTYIVKANLSFQEVIMKLHVEMSLYKERTLFKFEGRQQKVSEVCSSFVGYEMRNS